jgi:acetylornithine deacetylase/succinyl-diaminopimelate desuccinylase-like protein
VEHLQEAASRVDPDSTVALAQELIRIPSPTGEEQTIAEFLAEKLRAMGFDEVVVDKDWNVLASVRGQGDGPTLLLLTHTDSGPAGSMQDPYSGEIRDGQAYGKPGPVIYGRGAAAPKCALSCYIHAASALADWGRENFRGTLQVACVIQDLNANHDGIRILHQNVGLEPDFVIAGEPSNNQVVMGARGISHIQVSLRGKTSHWGKPHEGVNALYGLGELLLAVEKLELPTHPVLGGATVSAIEVSSELEPPHTPHIVRGVFDRRVLPEESVDDVLADFRRLIDQVEANRPGLLTEAEQIRGMFSFAAEPDSPLKEALLAGGRAVTGGDIGTTFIPFSSNAGFVIRELKVPGVAFAPGNITDVGPQEHVEVERLKEGTRILAAGCAALLAPDNGG